jgi:wyosine [tRNA(Phe)-imidazoG37] synthetase (radical SAM superfamily)
VDDRLKDPPRIHDVATMSDQARIHNLSPTALNPWLNTSNHDRDNAGMKYVYPVVSRRAGGVSVGINLNPNNACNWACIYCQVPNLARGGGPELDLAALETELRTLLAAIVHGDFMQTQVPEGARRLNDIALSGNGEPTSSRQFAKVIDLVGRMKTEFALGGKVKLVLISNGSLVDRIQVQAGLRRMAELDGELWFKVDSATAQGMRSINQTRSSPGKVFERLKIAAALCPTWLQTCVFARDGKPPSEAEQEAYLAFARRIKSAALPVKGVLLYGLARPSLQPGAERLSALSADWLEQFAGRIRQAGLACKVSA